ncbi:MAG: Fic family protein [Acidimicrobiia bacterium]|nr:Fic family protein [Acidimicrobiia bacterium]
MASSSRWTFGRTGVFGDWRHVQYLDQVFADLTAEDRLEGPVEGRRRRAAALLGEVNAAHPFRDGNGRTQRAFFRQLLRDAGWSLSWAEVTPEENAHTSAASLNGDDSSSRRFSSAPSTRSADEAPNRQAARRVEPWSRDPGRPTLGVRPPRRGAGQLDLDPDRSPPPSRGLEWIAFVVPDQQPVARLRIEAAVVGSRAWRWRSATRSFPTSFGSKLRSYSAMTTILPITRTPHRPGEAPLALLVELPQSSRVVAPMDDDQSLGWPAPRRGFSGTTPSSTDRSTRTPSVDTSSAVHRRSSRVPCHSRATTDRIRPDRTDAVLRSGKR